MALLATVKRGLVKETELMLKHGADPSYRDSQGNSLLMRASALVRLVFQNFKTELLLKYSSNLTLTTNRSPLTRIDSLGVLVWCMCVRVCANEPYASTVL